LTPEQKQLVRSTWALVAPIQEEAARLFYGRLFEIDPSTRALFASTDMAEQGRKLMQTIAVAVAGLERLNAILPAVEALGRRHVATGSERSTTRAWGQHSYGRWNKAWARSSHPRSKKRGPKHTGR
jgi:hemoglobin-like flavoprotein